MSSRRPTGGFDPATLYLHGGPAHLEGKALKRYGRHRSDAGALFFCADTPTCRIYAAGYAAWTGDPAVWKVRIDLSTDLVFDFSRTDHRKRLERVVSAEEWRHLEAHGRAEGQLDWTDVDEDIMAQAGFRGSLLHERSTGYFGPSAEALISIAVFDAADVTIVGRLTDAEMDAAWRAGHALVMPSKNPRSETHAPRPVDLFLAQVQAQTPRDVNWIWTAVDPHRAKLDQIESQRAGAGAQAMMIACGLADSHGITLTLEVETFENEDDEVDEDTLRLIDHSERLMAWYMGMGFEPSAPSSTGLGFVRRPGATHANPCPLDASPRENPMSRAAHAPGRRYHFVTDCVGACCGQHISEMVDQAQDVTYRTMREHCVGLKEVERMLGYGRDIGLSLASDWHVSFHKSWFGGIPCYYFVHSAIEYVFTLDGQRPTCEGREDSTIGMLSPRHRRNPAPTGSLAERFLAALQRPLALYRGAPQDTREKPDPARFNPSDLLPGTRGHCFIEAQAGWEDLVAWAQTLPYMRWQGRLYPRIRFGSESWAGKHPVAPDGCCGDCAVSPGQLHYPGCDIEECPICGGQAMMCYGHNWHLGSGGRGKKHGWSEQKIEAVPVPEEHKNPDDMDASQFLLNDAALLHERRMGQPKPAHRLRFHEPTKTTERLLAKLDPRSRQVLVLRYGLDGPPQTLDAVGGRLGVSRERVRQLEFLGLSEMNRGIKTIWVDPPPPSW